MVHLPLSVMRAKAVPEEWSAAPLRLCGSSCPHPTSVPWGIGHGWAVLQWWLSSHCISLIVHIQGISHM